MGKRFLLSFFVMLGFAGLVAFGQEEPAAGNSIISLVVILGVFAAVFYFMLIRPQRKRQAKHSALVGGLKRGDKIVTAGGIYGVIESIGDTSVVLTAEDGGKLRLAKSSIVEKQTQ
jgi:preprotein translocase subunit YajC